jgi:hypothetical protein
MRFLLFIISVDPLQANASLCMQAINYLWQTSGKFLATIRQNALLANRERFRATVETKKEKATKAQPAKHRHDKSRKAAESRTILARPLPLPAKRHSRWWR